MEQYMQELESIRTAGSRRRSVVLLACALGAPVLWSLEMLVSYSMVKWACSSPARLTTLRSIGIVFIVLSAIPLVASILMLFTTRALPEGADAIRNQRERFMAQLGILASLVFLLLIVMQTVPRYIISPCHT